MFFKPEFNRCFNQPLHGSLPAPISHAPMHCNCNITDCIYRGWVHACMGLCIRSSLQMVPQRVLLMPLRHNTSCGSISLKEPKTSMKTDLAKYCHANTHIMFVDSACQCNFNM